MARRARLVCGLCGANEKAAAVRRPHYAVRMGERWIARFTYPEGIQFASCCKAVVGDSPTLWTGADAARYTAANVGGVHVWICGVCASALQAKKAS